jgi:putative ATPase
MRGEADLRFDAIVSRSVLTRTSGQYPIPNTQSPLRHSATLLASLLRAGGVISLAEPVPRHSQRLYALADLAPLGAKVAEKLRAAEETIYAAPDDPLVNWTEEDLRAAFQAAGLAEVTVERQENVTETRITPALLARWFTPAPVGERPSYSQRLAALLNPTELAAVHDLYARTLAGQTMPWRSVTAYAIARRS